MASQKSGLSTHTEETEADGTEKSGLQCPLEKTQGSSTMKGVADSCVVHFEWQDFEGQLLSFLQKK